MAFEIQSRRVLASFLVVAIAVTCMAIAMHSPGQVSMDSSMQLYEASLGQSVSWNPPFMSALMRWLGGGELATAGIVLICSVMTYLGMAQVVAAALRARAAAGQHTLAGWRGLLCLLLLLNPVIFVYVGIIWKDVLFGSMLTSAVALSFAAAASSERRSLALAAAACVLLALAFQVRQQGLFMSPVLLGLPLLAAVSARGWARARRWLVAGGLAGLFVVCLLASKALVNHTITGIGDRSSSVGFRTIMQYDVAGTVARSTTATARLPVAITDVQRRALRETYTSLRIEFLASNPDVSAWLAPLDEKRLPVAWWSLVRHEPRAFLAHKWFTFRSVLDLNGVRACLPVHIGVEGNSDYLRAVGMTELRDGRDQALYRFAAMFFDWPVYRHWVYLLALLVGTVVVARATLPARFKPMCLVLAAACGLFYLSFLPTTIACDFRYLYGAIPLVSLLWLVVLAGTLHLRRAPAAADASI